MQLDKDQEFISKFFAGSPIQNSIFYILVMEEFIEFTGRNTDSSWDIYVEFSEMLNEFVSEEAFQKEPEIKNDENLQVCRTCIRGFFQDIEASPENIFFLFYKILVKTDKHEFRKEIFPVFSSTFYKYY